MIRHTHLAAAGGLAGATLRASPVSSTSSAGTTPSAKAAEDAPVYLKPSSSPLRKPSFYFPRMREERPPSEVIVADHLGTALPLFSITSPSCEYYALRLPLLRAGFKRLLTPVSSVACNLTWGRSMPLRDVAVNDANGHPVSKRLRFAPTGSVEHAAHLETLRMLTPYQRFNHFPLSHRNLGCKRGMTQNWRRVQLRAAKAPLPTTRAAVAERYQFLPKSWFYPEEKDDLLRAFRDASPRQHFIWKPIRGSCGRGILLSKGGAANAASWERVMKTIEDKAGEPNGRLYRHYVVQEYIEDPLLLDGRKMDLRLYVAVTSFDPLVAYWYEDGLVRLAAEAYEQSSESASGDASSDDSLRVANRFRHLTNYSVGRKYKAYYESLHEQCAEREATLGEAPSAPAPANSSDGSGNGENAASPTEGDSLSDFADPELKWSLPRLWSYLDEHASELTRAAPAVAERLAAEPGRTLSSVVREQIGLLIVRMLMAVKPNLGAAQRRVDMSGGFFEVYGFDVMLNQQLQPLLIEVNTLPSLESSSPFDYTTKTNMVSDLLNLCLIEPFQRDPDSLLPFLSHEAGMKLLQGTSETVQRSVHTLEEQKVAAEERSSETGEGGPFAAGPRQVGAPPTEDARRELQLRLQDELRYARGFKRIFPPPPPLVGEDYHVTQNSAEMQKDVAMFAELGLLSMQDEWALQA